jgi:S1-C subfamily serine protease
MGNLQGVAVGEVEPGSPAEKAGLVAATIGQVPAPGRSRRGGTQVSRTLGDVITQLNDRPIRSITDLYSALDRITPGETIDLTVWNNGSVRQVRVKTY